MTTQMTNFLYSSNALTPLHLLQERPDNRR